MGLGPQLRSLHLQKNQLQALPALPALSQLELVDLSGNPFRCDCQLLPLHRRASPRGPLAGDPQLLSAQPHDLPRLPPGPSRAALGAGVLPVPTTLPGGAGVHGLGVDASEL